MVRSPMIECSAMSADTRKDLECYIIRSMAEKPTGIEVQVVSWNDGSRDVAIYFCDFNQMLTLNPDGARRMAFLLMECADFLEPPFGDPPAEGEINPNDESESVALFGPYDEAEEDEEDPEEED